LHQFASFLLLEDEDCLQQQLAQQTASQFNFQPQQVPVPQPGQIIGHVDSQGRVLLLLRGDRDHPSLTINMTYDLSWLRDRDLLRLEIELRSSLLPAAAAETSG
jgi:hypothetical protein